MLKPVTHGHLLGLLSELGFQPKVIDSHNVVYRHEPSGCHIFLPNNPPDTPAREVDYMQMRSQFDWRGLMERDDFEMYFAKLAVAATRTRTKQA